jgi:hypothetical protein
LIGRPGPYADIDITSPSGLTVAQPRQLYSDCTPIGVAASIFPGGLCYHCGGRRMAIGGGDARIQRHFGGGRRVVDRHH